MRVHRGGAGGAPTRGSNGEGVRRGGTIRDKCCPLGGRHRRGLQGRRWGAATEGPIQGGVTVSGHDSEPDPLPQKVLKWGSTEESLESGHTGGQSRRELGVGAVF